MKYLFRLSLLLLLILPLSTYSQDENEMFEKMMKYINPAKEHEALHLFAGKWKQNLIRISGKDEIPGVGKSENNIIFGGRFLEMRFNQNYDNYTVNGIIYLGFNNMNKEYFLFGIDELGTASLNAKGSFDAKTNSLNLKGILSDPVTLKNIDVEINITKDRENKFTFEEFTVVNGKKTKVLLIQNLLLEEQSN